MPLSLGGFEYEPDPTGEKAADTKYTQPIEPVSTTTTNETNIKPMDGSTSLTTGTENGSGGITLPDYGGGQMDNALRAGFGSQLGGNPYFPDGQESTGNLSLGGAATEPSLTEMKSSGGLTLGGDGTAAAGSETVRPAVQPGAEEYSSVAPSASAAGQSSVSDTNYDRKPGDGMLQDATGRWTEPQDPQWVKKKEYMLAKVADGTATPEMISWVEKYHSRMAENESININVLPNDGVEPYTTGNRELDNAIGEWSEKVFSGEVLYAGLDSASQDHFIQSLDQLIASDPSRWQEIRDPDLKAAYIERYGNPADGVRGAADNTINPDGSVQGEYQAESGGAYQAEASLAGSMDEMSIERANAAFAAENGRNMTDDEMSSYRINQILASDSPLMMLAKQQGIEQASGAGLRNSSLAAGNSMAAMAEKATPLALQEAAAFGQMNSQNQTLESARLEANAGREQQESLFNADAENRATSQEFGTEADIRKFNAGSETDVSGKNAAMANQILDSDRQRDFQYNFQQLVGDQDFAKQTLATNTQVELQGMSDANKILISTNDSASKIMASLQTAIGEILGDPKIKGPEAETKIKALISSANDSIGVIGAISDMDLTDLVSPTPENLPDNIVQGPGGEWRKDGVPLTPDQLAYWRL